MIERLFGTKPQVEAVNERMSFPTVEQCSKPFVLIFKPHPRL